jgi:hypothetical protein
MTPDPDPDDQADRLDLLEASMTASEFFRSLEICDSKRVDDFLFELDNSVLEVFNVNGRN